MILNNTKLEELKKAKSPVKEGFIYNTIKVNNYTPKKRRLKGKEMIVVPVTMIVEGVLNGIYYGKEDMAISTELWNGMPVILNHPADGMSANRTEIIENYGLGTLYNTTFEINDNGQGLLNSEIWFEPEEMERVDSELHARVMSGGIVEVSTGLRVNLQYVEASYKGVDFYFVSSNYKPDHLAVLPENIGACSCADGCGIRQNDEDTQTVEISEKIEYDINENKKENNMANCNCPEKVAQLTAVLSISEETALSFNELQIDALLVAMTVKNEETAPEEGDTPEVTEETPETPAEEVQEEAPVEVEETQEPTSEEAPEGEEPKEEITANEEAPVEEVQEEAPVEAEVVAEEEKPQLVDSVEELSSVVAENLLNEVTEALSLMKETKQKLASDILSNEHNQFTKEELELKSMKELNAINALANSVVDYSLSSGAGITQNSAKEEKKQSALPVPTYK